jgi:tetratricopeptide (TPR) repeat protein
MEDNTYRAHSQALSNDRIATTLQTFSHWILVVVLGLSPIIFIPSAVFPVEFTKVFVVIAALLASLVLYGLSILRSGSITYQVPLMVYSFLGVVLAALCSALLSQDRFDSLVGNSYEVQTVGFLVVLAGIMLVPVLVNLSKLMIVRSYLLFAGSALLLGLFHIIRLFFGAEVMGFDIFTSPVSSPIGGWNSLGLFLGLTIILSLIAIEQLPLTRPGKIFFTGVVALSLVHLLVINFFAVWIVLALVSLVVVMYTMVKDRFGGASMSPSTQSNSSLAALGLSGLVCVVSVIAILAGSSISAFVSDRTGISYIEVRPSLGATLDIAGSVYRENALLGIGPNRFVDAWRLQKSPAINETLLWSVDFVSGYSYLTTSVVTLGLLGVVAWIIFLGMFVLTGIRMILRGQQTDSFWFFIGSSSLAAALYLWGMLFIYTPNVTILMLAAFFTGTMALAYRALCPGKLLAISLFDNKRMAIILVVIVMVTIVGSVSILYTTSRHYSSIVIFSTAMQSIGLGESVDAAEVQIERAYSLAANDQYLRRIAQLQIGKINSLLGIPEPNEMQQQEFERAIARGIAAAQQSSIDDSTDSQNWFILGSLYGVLAGVNIEGAEERAVAAFDQARTYDPQNPIYDVAQAQMYARIGKLEESRTLANNALTLKRDYSEPLLLLTQLAIAEGDLATAIATVQSVLSLEPNNPSRFFQLGVLFIADNNLSNATVALEQAVRLDTNYANARFLLARLYAQAGQKAAALEQLDVVRTLNPDNQEVLNLISLIESDQDVGFVSPADATVTNADDATAVEGEGVTSPGAPDSPLLTPVNVPAAESTNEPSTEEPAEQTE